MVPLLINFNDFIGKDYVDLGGIAIAAFVALAIAFGLVRWRSTLRSFYDSQRGLQTGKPSRTWTIPRGLISDVLLQKPVADCSIPRWAVHFSMFWGFVGLALATTLDAITNPAVAPLPLTSPVRLIGNVGGILFMAGVCLSIARRVLIPQVRKNTTLGDSVFLAVLFVTGLTGFVTEYLSDLNIFFPDQVTYWVHLAFVTLLLVTAPFTKFVHSIGRPLLLMLRRLAGGDGRGEASGEIP